MLAWKRIGVNHNDYQEIAQRVPAFRLSPPAAERLESVPPGRELGALADAEPAIPDTDIASLEVAAGLIQRVIDEVEPSRLPWRPLLHRTAELRV